MPKKLWTLRLRCQVSRHKLDTLVRQGANHKIILEHLGRDGRQLLSLLCDVQHIPGMSRFVDNDILSKAPSLGQHTEEILISLGYSNNQIEELINEGVIGNLYYASNSK